MGIALLLLDLADGERKNILGQLLQELIGMRIELLREALLEVVDVDDHSRTA